MATNNTQHPRWRDRLKRRWLLHHLNDKRFSFMLDPPPADEFVTLDCETTGIDVDAAEIISIAAVRIRGNTLLTSEKLELLVKPQKPVDPESVRIHQLRLQDVMNGMKREDAVTQLMQFIGSRPIVGYYLEFDVAMLDRVIEPMLGVGFGLPQPRHEVSAMYYDYKYRQLPMHKQDNPMIDLRFATLMSDLGLPTRNAHDALNDSIMAGLAFIKLRQLLAAK